jgi:hypothetical protein
MRADCKECQTLQGVYEQFSKAYLTLHKKIQADKAASDNPKRAATLNQGLQYIEYGIADISDAIRQHMAEVHSEAGKSHNSGRSKAAARGSV